MFACISKCLDTHTHTRKKAKSTHSHIASGGGRKPSYVQHIAEVIRRQNKYPGMFKNSYPNIIQPSTQTQTHTDSVVSQPRVSPTHQSKPRIPPDCAARILEANIQGTPHCEAHYSQLTRLPAGNTRKHTHTGGYTLVHTQTHTDRDDVAVLPVKNWSSLEASPSSFLFSCQSSIITSEARGKPRCSLRKQKEGFSILWLCVPVLCLTRAHTAPDYSRALFLCLFLKYFSASTWKRNSTPCLIGELEIILHILNWRVYSPSVTRELVAVEKQFEAMSILKATWCEHWTEFVTKVAFSSIFVLTLEVYAAHMNERDAEMCLKKENQWNFKCLADVIIPHQFM